MFELLKHLINNLGYIIVVSFFVSNLKGFKKIIQKETFDKKDLFILSILFGTLGIVGTYVGIDVKGAIANTRNIGIMVGGILGGPIVGFIAGLIAGIHRVAIDFGGVTSIPCSIATILGGLLGGYFYKKSNLTNRWIYGLVGGIIVENMSMSLILLMSRPFDLALDIVESIYVPMILANSIGISIVILIIEHLFEEKDQMAGENAKIALEIANKTLPYFRDVNKNSLNEICKIILDSVEAYAVIITDRENILAYVDKNGVQSKVGESIKTKETKEVIRTGNEKVLTSFEDLKCTAMGKKYVKSGIIVPLHDADSIVGTLKIYFEKEAIEFREKQLALGLSQIMSTQLEISKMEKLKEMATKAEIKALQAQINPHFLFNALNTITSFVRIDPTRARELIIDLSTYLRYNIEIGDNLVDLEKELEQVNAYVNIEKARFKDKIEVVYDIEDDIDIQIPSLIIQPLVENSIKHGILKTGSSGRIQITAKKEDEKVLITIEDDGVGISEEIIERVYSNSCRENKIGLSNVHNRIKLIYGKGLDISKTKKGTRISFEVA